MRISIICELFIKRIIIPKFTANNENIKKFIPDFVKIHKGEVIEWINMENKMHVLSFYHIFDGSPKLINKLGAINGYKSARMKFDYDYHYIDYCCELHNEWGKIIIFSKGKPI